MSIPLVSAGQMAALRLLGLRAMQTDVTIRLVGPYAHETAAENPFGDDDLEIAAPAADVTVKGWVKSAMGRSFDEDASQVVTTEDLTLRVPYGTVIRTKSLVFINGVQFKVVEVADEETWPIWTECYIRRTS